jgi:hypothetical protein
MLSSFTKWFFKEPAAQVTMSGSDYSPRSMAVLQAARAEASGRPIQPEHLALGLLNSGNGVVEAALHDLGLSREDAVSWLREKARA